jgi:hypothetical protein
MYGRWGYEWGYQRSQDGIACERPPDGYRSVEQVHQRVILSQWRRICAQVEHSGLSTIPLPDLPRLSRGHPYNAIYPSVIPAMTFPL